MSAIFDSILSEGFSVTMFLACLAAAGICLGCLTRCVKPRLGEPRLARTLTFTAAEAAVSTATA